MYISSVILDRVPLALSDVHDPFDLQKMYGCPKWQPGQGGGWGSGVGCLHEAVSISSAWTPHTATFSLKPLQHAGERVKACYSAVHLFVLLLYPAWQELTMHRAPGQHICMFPDFLLLQSCSLGQLPAEGLSIQNINSESPQIPTEHFWSLYANKLWKPKDQECIHLYSARLNGSVLRYCVLTAQGERAVGSGGRVLKPCLLFQIPLLYTWSYSEFRVREGTTGLRLFTW